jgi:hypothetical protein
MKKIKIGIKQTSCFIFSCFLIIPLPVGDSIDSFFITLTQQGFVTVTYVGDKALPNR